jgi:hypothetical protein
MGPEKLKEAGILLCSLLLWVETNSRAEDPPETLSSPPGPHLCAWRLSGEALSAPPERG